MKAEVSRRGAKLALLNRERAILEFNHRVLAQARRPDVPYLERLRYVCIVSSNLDEFFEVRFGDYLDASRLPDGGVSAGDLAEVAAAAHELITRQYAVFNDEVMPALQREGIVILNHAQRNAAQRRWVEQFFHRYVRPLLVPVGLDPAHPFPQVANKSLNFIVKLGGKDAFGRENGIAIVKVPRVLPRVIRLPDELAARGQQAFVLLSSVIRAHLEELFPGRPVEAFSQFRVTRDSDLAIDEQDVTNLRQALRTSLSTRHFGKAIRLEVVSSCPPELSAFLLHQFGLPDAALYRVNGPVNLVRLNQLIQQADAPALRFPRFEPAWPAALQRAVPIFEQLRQQDVLLHHPFESFEPVVQLLREAVYDPDVLAIKQTIYRTGAQSVLMDLLLEAARRGKEVMAVVELKARHDEEANINWAEQLEAVGAQVVYGVVGLKTHAKLLLITRREAGRSGPVLRRYAHLSTGNYNPRTARQYTDVGYLTADPDLTADVDTVFRQLASLTRLRAPRLLLMAPFTLHRQLLRHLGQVAEAAAAGRPARVVLKLNALTDVPLIEALVHAAQAGAQVDLVVRGACILPPGVKGWTERVRVRSVVGRFLEHSRVLYFRWGRGADEEVLYLSSADWMSRNMFRRIEVAWPVRDAALRQRIIDECLVPYLHDAKDAWRQLPDGRYERIGTDGPSAQQALLARYSVQPAVG
ncbi:polyphosphate kinase 1 [Caldimonas thermodepolymerans]|jgi:polyphosphate kinase 1|uniref:Polyphosphate kinase n=1 Tax=Caldimonas thermodepolymerans TaxID=215580 RepID=A0A2S5T9F8_9BURK|nr:polyphosphate kinase 1 [Caldimonas thermodepolymerans]PPE71644.1 polyphosphate kinase 1 [Caldimonas thermodepolymerans]QPC30672.1 polyphosphate kinase 1 [Caldimonas thermodepolymerans]RDI02720.1 polyphosphate kinase [Caldimonas thermodepolymerans]TCP08750.1 polyphosphate kinase [Caldimonas thermodepolymerans]